MSSGGGPCSGWRVGRTTRGYGSYWMLSNCAVWISLATLHSAFNRGMYCTSTYIHISKHYCAIQYYNMYGFDLDVIRLKESCGVDVLSDCLLLNVFSYLDARSLLRASQVSRHWHRLCSTEVLWKAHCSNLGLSEGMGGLTGALEALGQGRWVDWKQAFKQLKTIVKRIKNIVIKSGEEGSTYVY